LTKEINIKIYNQISLQRFAVKATRWPVKNFSKELHFHP